MGVILSNLINLLNSFGSKIILIFAWIFDHLDESREKIIANFLLITIFALIYWLIQKFQKNEIFSPYSTDELSAYDAIYFSFVVHFTLGFGDIFPSGGIARLMVIIHTTLFWFINLVDTALVKKFILQFYK